jgi:hypothetical protein
MEWDWMGRRRDVDGWVVGAVSTCDWDFWGPSFVVRGRNAAVHSALSECHPKIFYFLVFSAFTELLQNFINIHLVLLLNE